jgi:S1-C subfamily serine protease
MIDTNILNRVRCGVCAIGYVTVNMEEYKKNPTRPYFKVCGTGFLVRDNTVMTNRHVIEEVHKAQQQTGFSNDQIRIHFVYSVQADEWKTDFRRFESLTSFKELDIALVEINRQPGEMEPCHSLPLGDLSSIAIAQPIAVWGYPYGTSMLAPQGTLRRFGPVLQQGYISAISPYDASSRIDELLLDVRTVGGMSGSPVFRPEDGRAIGIVYATWEAITSVAIPIDDARVAKWLAVHDEGRAKIAQSPSPQSAQVGPGDPPLTALVHEEASVLQLPDNGDNLR